MSFRGNVILIALAVWNTVAVKPFYALLRLLGWPERQPGTGDDGSPQ